MVAAKNESTGAVGGIGMAWHRIGGGRAGGTFIHIGGTVYWYRSSPKDRHLHFVPLVSFDFLHFIYLRRITYSYNCSVVNHEPPPLV